VLEAMATGAVVVTSNVSSLPEVAGDAAILVDPLTVESIAGGISSSINDLDLRDRLRAAAIRQAAGFTWSRTARETMAVYRRVAG
jgi:glycosyltransferase involved in cell wall biosynthesis